MADEYIKKSDALNAMEWKWAGEGAFKAVKEVPPADVVEVRHGKWRTVDIFSEKGYGERYYQHKECSTELYKSPYNFCPHCGAKMDGE